MHKIISIFLLLTTYIFSNINVAVSILPQQTFLKSIGGNKVNIILMVQPGNSPHTYEPKPSQMQAISKAQLYFAMDVEFEHVWLSKFKDLNNKMQIIDTTKNIKKISISENHNHKKHTHTKTDPHTWTSPNNVKIIAQNIYEALKKYDIKNADYYKTNLKVFLHSIEETNLQIKEILSKLGKNRKFMVFHPSWGYFAKTYNLTQITVEVEGKTPKSKELIKLIKEAKKEKITAIFTQPEFSDSSAKIIAKELNIPVVKVTPLAENWSENLITIAKNIVGIH